MTSKSDQIEEMATVLCDDCKKHLSLGLPCKKECCTSSRQQAEALYNAGYRKVGDIEKNFISKKAIIACGNHKGATKHLLMCEKVIDEVRKETAREILQSLYDYCFELADPYSDSDEPNGDITPDDIKFYAKKYGVEVEE